MANVAAVLKLNRECLDLEPQKSQPFRQCYFMASLK